MLALIKGLPDDAAVWRQDKPGWTTQDELQASIAETIDAWGRRITFWLTRGPVGTRKNDPSRIEFPESLVDLQHPDRPRRGDTPSPRPRARIRPRDEHGRAPAHVDVAAARRFFGGGSITARR